MDKHRSYTDIKEHVRLRGGEVTITREPLTFGVIREMVRKMREQQPRGVLYMADDDFDSIVREFDPDAIVDPRRRKKATLYGVPIQGTRQLPPGTVLADMSGSDITL